MRRDRFSGVAPSLQDGQDLQNGLSVAAPEPPVLGVVLLFEAISLMTLIRDVSRERSELWVALVVAAAVVSLPYGYVIGLAVGTAIALGARRGWLQTPTVGTGGASASD